MMPAIAISVYIIGLLIMYTWGTPNTWWYEYYYLWDKGKDLLIFIALFYAVNKKMKTAIKPVIFFSSARFLWQIISSTADKDINNIIAIDYLFITLAFICSWICIKELIKWHKSNGL